MYTKMGFSVGIVGGAMLCWGGVVGGVAFGWFLGGVECSFLLDFYSSFFLVVGCYVTSSILLFSMWYMGGEPGLGKFILYLMAFLLFMLLLVFAGNLVFLMVGWEGVGIMSFLLISWWGGRSEATVAGLQAVIYNRVGDFGLYMAVFSLVGVGVGVGMGGGGVVGWLVLMLLLVGGMAKSSQFFFHPWLPSAMEGPTPVSSLLHSSTMVVAGVFLLIRLEDILGAVGGAVFVVGAVTMLYGSLCAFGQMDMKKVVAFSTTSQLGLMVCGLGMGFYLMAFFHMCMHAFFKSLIFITSGVFIHSAVGGTQDIRGGGFSKGFTFLCLMLSSLSLGGFPFFAGFYSKDVLLENMYGPVLNRFGVMLLVCASALTVGYSLKLALSVGGGWKEGVGASGLVEGSEGPAVVWFMLRLGVLGVTLGVVAMGAFGLVGEEYLSVGLKVVPLGILFTGALLGSGSWGGWSGASVLNLGTFMYSYNPLIHRVFVLGFLKFWGEVLGIFEYMWWEATHVDVWGALSGGLLSGGQWGFGGGIRGYFLWFTLIGALGGGLVMITW
uniref:NADH-ubiquinone oxidoreductase chain 5 n=1 Tax=Phallusia fumigata TaxID=395376 RepID=A7WL97_9ASCI|nr:NADH dehydrogenase subunit 5 [Phallusia fumigata]CAL24365.1 NADH dehydrogenase subunit 5 [Phallusia fumigata]